RIVFFHHFTDKIINGFLYPRMLRIDQYTHIGFVASFTYTVNTLHDACIFGFFGFAEFLFGLYFSKKVETSQPRWLEHTKRDIFIRSEEHTSELQSRENLVCRLLLEKKKITNLR